MLLEQMICVGGKVPRLRLLDLSVRAAEAGFGVSIGDISLISDVIEEGRVVLPFDFQLMSGRGIYYVYPIKNERQPGIAEFGQWLSRNSPIAEKTSAH